MMIQVGDLLNKRYRVLKELKPGGFAQIFEVQDIWQRNLKNGFGLLRGRSIKILKVLNHFGSRQQDAEFLFRREIGLLKQLDHPAVVRHADDFDLIHDQRIIPCLVMEKVPGVTMEEWLQENGAVSEEIALDWLLQFGEMLDYLHNDQRVMHLDIKPANVMVTPRGELVLIDFGLARPISSTLLAKLVDFGESMQHRAATDWFSAPEQLQGRPIAQSDFYSIGRTMIRAITNKLPEHLIEDDEGNLLWTEETHEISPPLINCIDILIQFSPKQRLSESDKLRKSLTSLARSFFSYKQRLLNKFENFTLFIAVPSILLSSLILLIRFFGILQVLETATYDFAVRIRPDTEGPDPRIAIIKVTSEDTKRQAQLGIDGEGSLSDIALQKLLDKIQPYDPEVIGIDIFRQNNLSALSKENVILGCSISPGNPDFRIPPPYGFPLDRVGFFNLTYDKPGNVVRRYFIAIDSVDEKYCDPGYSFSYQLVKSYIRSKGLSASSSSTTENVHINGFQIKKVKNHQGFYDKIIDADYQSILNYRTYPEVAESVALFDILDNKISEEYLRRLIYEKVVIIGTTDESYGDVHNTPYGKQPGVTLQAHMVSNMLSLAFGEKRDIAYFSRVIESLLIYVMSILFYTCTLQVSNRCRYIFVLLISFIYGAVYLFLFVFYSFILPLTPFVLLTWLLAIYMHYSSKRRRFIRSRTQRLSLLFR